MKMSKKLILASVVLPLILSTSGAFAYGGKDHKGHHGGECRSGLDRGMMAELDLTDSQKEQFKELYLANKEGIKANFKNKPEQNEAMQEAHINKLNDLLLADTFDPAKATVLAQEISNTHVERQVDMLSKKHKMLSILTPEQKAKFIELQKERMNECGDNMSSHKGKDRN